MPFDAVPTLSETEMPIDPDASWRDRLVELHVLAEHGDRAAAGEAQAWIDTDERAHRAWHEIEDACHLVRGA